MTDDLFWADQEAQEVINNRGKKKSYLCEAGITPSGPKHIGNFREVITVDLIVKALRDAGKKVKFQYVWDSYDRFRKVPAEVPVDKTQLMELEIGKPVCDVIDPWGCHDSWAEHWMRKFEQEVSLTGIKPSYVRQHELYRRGVYADEIRKALVNRSVIIKDLNKYRSEPLSPDWWPIKIYCSECGKDFTKVLDYDDEYSVEYSCKCGYSERIDFRKKGIVKLRWRVDWPMRWSFYDVDFEPAGKEHMVEGSSRTTGRLIIKDVYKAKPPYGFMYGLVRLKGGPGKMSASKGNVIFISDALKVYLKPVLRFIFAGNRPASDFPISFDDDVLKVYEDFYQCERAYYGKEPDLNDKRLNHLKRVYEFCVDKPTKTMPVQLGFRTAALIVQTTPERDWLKQARDLERVLKRDESRLLKLFEAANYWVKNHASEQYRFVVNDKAPKIKLKTEVKQALNSLGEQLLKSKKLSHDSLNNIIFELARPIGLRDFFTAAYQVIISKKRGPRLAQFILTIGQDKIGKLLSSV